MKYASIKHLACALVTTLAFPTAALAASPVAVWDGDFSDGALSQNGYTLDLNGNTRSQDGSTITISQNVGVKCDFNTAMTTGLTVLYKYSDLDLSVANQTIATSCVNDDKTGDRSGVYLTSNGAPMGIWATTGDYNSGATENNVTSSQTAGVFAFVYYKTTAGTKLYHIDNGTCTTIFDCTALGSINDNNIYGFTLGGDRSTVSNRKGGPATGLKITGIAVFSKVLSTAEMSAYVWPSEQAISVNSDTSISWINSQIGVGYKKIIVFVADGITITADEAFSASTPIFVSSTGSITLSAPSQPDASYFDGVDFSGVQGGLLRSWLTELVRGFNFRSRYGTDTSGALAVGTWTSNDDSANGSSTAIFADGLSTLTWYSGGLWSSGTGSILSGYLDDGYKNGFGPEVYISNVPYETYDVIIYCNSDSNPGDFRAKTVNGKTYTWDAVSGAVVEGSSTWGKAALSIPVYGVNALRVKNLSGPLTIYGDYRHDQDIHRGCITAIQIMPPETPDNITYYTLTLNGTATTWSGGMWTLNGQTVSAPTSGYVKIVATDSSALTVDQAISLANLVVTGDVNTVVNVATNGNGSLYTIKATVESGVFQQGSPAVLGTTPAVVVEDGATFDLNGLAVSESNAFSIEGDGAGNWPWALTSSGGASDIVKTITLTGDATIGGANQIKLGKTKVANDLTLNGHTLAKTGSGELYCTNLRFFGGGTLDLQDGTTSFNQWTSLDGSETIDRHTTVIVRNGATIVNNAGRRLWIDTLDIRNGTVTTTASGYFGVSSVFTGACDTVHLQLNNGAIAALSGNLTTETMECESASFAKVDGAAPVTVTPGTLTASGAISVGAGITFNLGTSRPAATFAVDDNATISVQKANAADVPMIKVTAQPANIVLYDENGSAVASPTVMYDSENGTISLGTGIIWVGGSGTWSASQFDGKAVETDGKDVSFAQGVPPQSAVTVTVDGAKSVNNMSFNASDTVYTLTGDKITTADGLAASGTAPVVISNELEVAGAVTLGACASLTLATDVFDMADGALSGAGTFVLDPGEGNTITMTKNNTSYTGEAVIKSGTVKMGSATSFGPCLGSGGIRVSSGAIIDTFGCLADTGEGIRTTLILEGGATYTATASTANLEQFPFSTIMLQGYALVDSDYQTGLARKYFDPTVLSLGEYKLTKAGSGTLYLAATAITGAGELDVQEGVLRVNNGYWYDSDNQCSCDNGTIRIGKGASLDLSYYRSTKWQEQQANSPMPVLRVKNIVIDGVVRKTESYNSCYFTVSGYVSGSGSTPMLTLANGAVFKPSGTGYLRITESLTLPNDNTLTVDISDVDFSAGKSIPLFKVGLAEMLPDIAKIKMTGGTLPDGWELAKTADGLGYRIRNLNRQLRLILR